VGDCADQVGTIFCSRDIFFGDAWIASRIFNHDNMAFTLDLNTNDNRLSHALDKADPTENFSCGFSYCPGSRRVQVAGFIFRIWRLVPSTGDKTKIPDLLI